jgi:hypothetical protein
MVKGFIQDAVLFLLHTAPLAFVIVLTILKFHTPLFNRFAA